MSTEYVPTEYDDLRSQYSQYADKDDHWWKRQQSRAKKAGFKDLASYFQSINEPYVNTAKTGSSLALAGSNNMGSTEDASINANETPLPSAQSPDVTETINEAATKKLGTDLEGNLSPDVQEKVNELEKQGSVKTLGNSVVPPVVKKKKKSRIKSILQAYYDGDIDKNERDYLIADTLGTFARNLGKDVGNVAAAYSGGTANNERESSLWESKNKEMAGALSRGTAQAAEADITGSDKQIERISTIGAQNMIKRANELRAQGNEQSAAMLEMVAAGMKDGVDLKDYLFRLLGENPEFGELVDNVVGAGAKSADVINKIFSLLSGDSSL